jgi:hypothetical protein
MIPDLAKSEKARLFKGKLLSSHHFNPLKGASNESGKGDCNFMVRDLHLASAVTGAGHSFTD